MKFSQVLLMIIMINLIVTIVGFALTHSNVEDFDDTIVNWFSADPDSWYNKFSSFASKVRSDDNWVKKFFADIAQGFTTAINLVTIGFQLLFLVLYGWITPNIYMIDRLTSTDSIPILNIFGLLSLALIQWYNIHNIIRAYTLLKGSDN